MKINTMRRGNSSSQPPCTMIQLTKRPVRMEDSDYADKAVPALSRLASFICLPSLKPYHFYPHI